jgi:uncharacterized membrane protein YgdD (TMEM256/DUF423 family)
MELLLSRQINTVDEARAVIGAFGYSLVKQRMRPHSIELLDDGLPVQACHWAAGEWK